MITKNKINSLFLGLIDSKNFSQKLLLLLLITDLIFITVHCLNIYGIIDRNILYYIGDENSYAEVYQFIKELWIFLLLFSLFLKKKSFIIFIWAMLFLYILMDDSLTIHESLGEFLANYLDITSNFYLRAVDFGELIVSFSIGLIFLILSIFAYRKSNIKIKRISENLFLLVICLTFFGIFIDMLHVFFEDSHKLGLVEDGGEMLVISLIASYTFKLS